MDVRGLFSLITGGAAPLGRCYAAVLGAGLLLGGVDVFAQANLAPDPPSISERLISSGSLDEALGLAEALLAVAIASGDADHAMAVLDTVDRTPFLYAETPDAQDRFADMLRAVEADDLPQPGRARFQVAVLVRIGYAGRLDEAQLGLATTLARHSDALRPVDRASAHYMLAYCAFYLADAEGAIRYARLAADDFLLARDTMSAMEAFDGMSTSHFRLGRVDSALIYGRRALALTSAIRDSARVYNVYLNYAEAVAGSGRPDSAYFYLDAADRLTTAARVGMRARLDLAYATVHGIVGRRSDRIASLLAAADGFGRNNEHHQQATVFDTTAVAYAAEGDWREAYAYRDRAAAQRDSLYAERVRKDTDRQLAEQERAQLARERMEASARERLSAAALAEAKLERTLYGLTAVGLCAALAAGVYRYRRRRLDGLRLQGLVDQRTAALREQAEELRASNEELERFAYIASHDLKTPLRNVTSFVNLAQRRLPPGAHLAVGEYLQIASDNARHMHELVSDVLEYSRIGKAEPEAARPLSVDALAAEIVRGMSAHIAERRAVVTLDGAATAALPRTALSQVLTNLVENGLKYNRSEVPRVSVDIVDLDTAVRIAVTDNGIGIDAAYHDKIFEVFRRLHTVDEFSGTGVGLSSCLKIVKGLGGSIEVDSEIGVGSTFRVTLPKPSVQPPLADAPRDRARPSRRPPAAVA